MTTVSAHDPIRPGALTRDQLYRALGVLMGAACGDALGAPFEFGGPGQWFARFAEPVLGGTGEMIGGGGFNWAPGEFTDDTQMAVALAESIIASGGIDPDHLWLAFRAWRTGATDVGINTGIVLSQESRHGAAERAHEAQRGRSASNGCIMRIGPVGIWGVTVGRERTIEAAVAQAELTHFDPAAAAGAAITAEIIRRVIVTGSITGVAEQVVQELSGHAVIGEAAARYAPLVSTVYAPGADPREPSNGSVWTAFAQALWAVRTTATFEEAMVAAIELGGDTDTVAAIAGAMAGALYGAQRIPVRWMSCVHGTLQTVNGTRRTYRNQDLIDLARRLLGKTASRVSPAERPAGPAIVHPAGVHAANLDGAASAPADHAVVSMCITEGRFTGRTHHRQILLHDKEGDHNNDIFFVVRDGVEAIDAFLAEGKQVVVHCHGGRSRTGLLLKAWYMKREGVSHSEAHDWLEECWPLYQDYNNTFWQFLELQWTDHLASA
ncbi:MAG: ADP-ribosylglycohydrolase family protein [Acidimicrobiales bacterium]